MTISPMITRLQDLADVNRLANKNALADVLDETAQALREADSLIRDFPTMIFPKPGERNVVGARETSEYAFRRGEWTRRRDAFLERTNKR